MEALHYIISAKLRPKYAPPLSNRAAHGSEYIDESPVKSPTALFALHKMRGISNEIITLLVWSK